MLIQSLFIFASAVAASASAVSSDLCIKGCCGLKFKLPAASLALHSTGDSAADAITVPLNDPAITCCPCDDQVPNTNSTGNASIPDPSTDKTALPVCAECQPCRADCDCPVDHKTICISPGKPGGGGHGGADNPDGLPICAENRPCRAGCTCSFLRRKQEASLQASLQEASVPICPEGQPCHEDCICTFDSMMAFINPSDLGMSTIICPVGECSDHCICRDEMLGSVKDVLFPASRPSTKDSNGKGPGAKDEL